MCSAVASELGCNAELGMSAIGRKRTVKNWLLLKSNVRYAPESGPSGNIAVNGR